MSTLEDYIKDEIQYPNDPGLSYLDFNISDKDRSDILTRFEKYDRESKRLVNIILKKFTKNDIKQFEALLVDSTSDASNFVSYKVLEYFYTNPKRPKTFFLNDDNSSTEYKGPPLILKTDEPKKLKIGVKRIKETEAIIKNQEKTIKGKKKQILNEQEYLNTMGNIMTGESNFIDNKGKWAVSTELDVKEGLNPKIRRALKKSIIEQANKIKGTNIIMDF